MYKNQTYKFFIHHVYSPVQPTDKGAAHRSPFPMKLIICNESPAGIITKSHPSNLTHFLSSAIFSRSSRFCF